MTKYFKGNEAMARLRDSKLDHVNHLVIQYATFQNYSLDYALELLARPESIKACGMYIQSGSIQNYLAPEPSQSHPVSRMDRIVTFPRLQGTS